MNKGAIISDDGLHRYQLWRIWDATKPLILFIGLNPSRADAEITDPTITRCINFAKSWKHEYPTFGEPVKYGGIYFGNLYSWRTPYPDMLIANLNKAADSFTDYHLDEMMNKCAKTGGCWGSWKFITGRSMWVLEAIKEPWCLGTNKDGQPKHPLYLAQTTELKKYESKK